ncbi:hypothetical protein H2201_002819 [Coniosporium apollinis]|uniref:CAF1-domain-containing protein n=1 Tax=Coniosporium apollinis TaxID=61459 RepID=A0ABQ9NZ49_9PEZI|nr:hypothetical protein H2201_002819 [Coniosporium apollinis]
MEVDRTAFYPRLLEILQHISESHFVAIDVELSGIASKSRISQGRQTLQERYSQVRDAANRYQILQIGLTCVEQDEEQQKYIVRPYNFNLNPMVEEGLGIERDFGFSSSAVDFLVSHGFDMGTPFHSGVGYLSREEAKKAKEIANEKLTKSDIADIQLKEDDLLSLAFMKKVRGELDAWIKGGMSKNCLNITSSKSVDPLFPELNSFERRLVHQLVRAEYPEFITLSKPAGVQIKPLDVEREEAYRKRKKKAASLKIAERTAFRWVIEALCGGSLHRIQLEWFARNPETGEAKYFDIDDYSARFERARSGLEQRRPVLVGHNVFTDLVNIYKCFIGELPETVEDFAKKVHELFPMVVDTKYMATHDCGGINPKSSLEEIEEQLRLREKPRIETHARFTKYATAEATHEAGYDSCLTALVMILLSAKLEAAGTYTGDAKKPDPENAPAAAPKDAKPSVDFVQNGLNIPHVSTTFVGLAPELPAPALVTPLAPTSAPAPISAAKAKKQRRKARKASATPTIEVALPTEAGEEDADGPDSATSRFSHTNPFANLTNTSADEPTNAQKDVSVANGDVVKTIAASNDSATDEERVEHIWGSPLSPSAAARRPGWAVEESVGPEPPLPDNSAARVRGEMMPPFDSAAGFWEVYGNKLRVFGTVEAICPLV